MKTILSEPQYLRGRRDHRYEHQMPPEVFTRTLLSCYKHTPTHTLPILLEEGTSY